MRLVPLAVADLHRGMPDAEVMVVECGPPKAAAKLGRGDIDLAVTFRRVGAPAPEGVEERILLEESMYALVPRRHRVAERGEVELGELRDDAWIQGPSATSPGLIRELCREAGFEPRIAFESDDPLATRGMVAAGLAVTLVPGLTKSDTARDRNVSVLALRDPPRRHVLAATAAGGRHTQATRARVDALARAGARIGRATV
jgi:DNA-binding transcriptional LysR family regulator